MTDTRVQREKKRKSSDTDDPQCRKLTASATPPNHSKMLAQHHLMKHKEENVMNLRSLNTFSPSMASTDEYRMVICNGGQVSINSAYGCSGILYPANEVLLTWPTRANAVLEARRAASAAVACALPCGPCRENSEDYEHHVRFDGVAVRLVCLYIHSSSLSSRGPS